MARTIAYECACGIYRVEVGDRWPRRVCATCGPQRAVGEIVQVLVPPPPPRPPWGAIRWRHSMEEPIPAPPATGRPSAVGLLVVFTDWISNGPVAMEDHGDRWGCDALDPVPVPGDYDEHLWWAWWPPQRGEQPGSEGEATHQGEGAAEPAEAGPAPNVVLKDGQLVATEDIPDGGTVTVLMRDVIAAGWCDR